MSATVAETATLAHGYTMADVDRLTHAAAKWAWGARVLDPTDRWDYAWHGIVERLYDNEKPPPSRRDLLKAGIRAITAAAHAQFSNHGITRDAQPAPNFTKYWHGSFDVTDGFTEKLAERLALPQVLSLLTGDQYEALAALSVYGNQRDAATSLGIEVTVLRRRVNKARHIIKRAWIAPDTPARRRQVDLEETCRSGHPRAEFGRVNKQGKWHCVRCARNRSRRDRVAKA